MRISFVGGGTDFPEFYREHGGAVISAAIDKYIYVIFKRRDDASFYIHWSKGREVVDDVQEIEHDLVRESLKLSNYSGGAEICIMSDVPAGTGLGSSGTLIVGLLKASFCAMGKPIDTSKLIRSAFYIERDILGRALGYQDQAIAAHGGVCYIHFKGDLLPRITDLTNDLDLTTFTKWLAVYRPNYIRDAQVTLVPQRNKIAQNTTPLTRMRDLVRPFVCALTQGDYEECGRILEENWLLKKSQTPEISTPFFDEVLYGTKRYGTIGGKILGAGGGGHILFIAPPDTQTELDNFMAGKGLSRLPIRLGAYRNATNID